MRAPAQGRPRGERKERLPAGLHMRDHSSSTRRAHALPTCSTRAATSTHKVLWPHVGLGSCNERLRSTGFRWRANGALAAPVQPWPSAWRCGGLWTPPPAQGELPSSASAAAATPALSKSDKVRWPPHRAEQVLRVEACRAVYLLSAACVTAPVRRACACKQREGGSR